MASAVVAASRMREKRVFILLSLPFLLVLVPFRAPEPEMIAGQGAGPAAAAMAWRDSSPAWQMP